MIEVPIWLAVIGGICIVIQAMTAIAAIFLISEIRE